MKQILKGIMLGLILAALLVGAGMLLTKSQDDPLAQERSAAAFRRAQVWAVVVTSLGIVLAVALALGLLGSILAAVRWANRMAGEIRPIDGILPVQRGLMLAWRRGPRLLTFFHDPNKTAGPTAVYAAAGVGNLLEVTQVPIEIFTPVQERVTARAQAVQAVAALPRQVRSLGSGKSVIPQALETEQPGQTFQYPSQVHLNNLVDEPSIDRLVLGVSVDQETGQQEIVRAAMRDLVHIAVGGSSGWGKSVFLRALAYQMAMSTRLTQLVLIDLERVTFAPFAQCGRLLYPVVDDERDAQAVMAALVDELNRRRDLYAQFPGVDSLHAYNGMVEERLPPIIALFDEATVLLGEKPIENATRTLALRARKYGLWLVLGGQDWKASSLDTAIRNMLSTRVQFAANSPSQSRVLLDQSGAEKLDTPGRALVIMRKRKMFELQSPYISYRQIARDLANGGPMHGMPTLPVPEDSQVRRILAMAKSGMRPTPIAREIYGYVNGSVVADVREIIEKYGDDDDRAALIEEDSDRTSSSSV
jgi:hypothetical protein